MDLTVGSIRILLHHKLGHLIIKITTSHSVIIPFLATLDKPLLHIILIPLIHLPFVLTLKLYIQPLNASSGEQGDYPRVTSSIEAEYGLAQFAVHCLRILNKGMLDAWIILNIIIPAIIGLDSTINANNTGNRIAYRIFVEVEYLNERNLWKIRILFKVATTEERLVMHAPYIREPYSLLAKPSIIALLYQILRKHILDLLTREE